MTVWRAVVCLVLVFAAACATESVSTPLPTLTLIPSTATLTPTPITPTATPPVLPGPEDVISTPQAGTVLIPAAAQPLVSQVLDDLAATLNLDRDSIRLMRLESATWASVDLGCGDQARSSDSGTGALVIDGFRIVLEVDGQDYEYHTDSQTAVRLCNREGVVEGTTDTLLATDPVAAELVLLAQRRLADELDLPVRRITLLDVVPVTWLDSSLGCPQPDQTYVAVEVEGYRIVLGVGSSFYIFHTDPERLIACDADREQMPR